MMVVFVCTVLCLLFLIGGLIVSITAGGPGFYIVAVGTVLLFCIIMVWVLTPVGGADVKCRVCKRKRKVRYLSTTRVLLEAHAHDLQNVFTGFNNFAGMMATIQHSLEKAAASVDTESLTAKCAESGGSRRTSACSSPSVRLMNKQKHELYSESDPFLSSHLTTSAKPKKHLLLGAKKSITLLSLPQRKTCVEV